MGLTNAKYTIYVLFSKRFLHLHEQVYLVKLQWKCLFPHLQVTWRYFRLSHDASCDAKSVSKHGAARLN